MRSAKDRGEIMRITDKALICLSACACLFTAVATSIAQTPSPAPAQAPQPKRINRAIELLEEGQPIYYTGSHSGTAGTFDQGKQDAQTWADYISYDMEAAPYDIEGLKVYMEGLVAGGPTRTGHRTPAVIVNLPVRGTDEATMRANAWMVEQVLATGVHGILLCHATTAGAVRALVEAVRYPNRMQGVGQQGLQEGHRGAHGAVTAAKIWGVSPTEYEQKADTWPLNPEGEIILGVKIEDKYGYANREEILKVPGIAFGEGGPGDMSLSFGFKHGDNSLNEVENTIFAAAKIQHLYWLGIGESWNGGRTEAGIETGIKSGLMIGYDERTAAIGRKITQRPLPY
jgi:4-hydroxy-2-oxoheptanedioate aldolase